MPVRAQLAPCKCMWIKLYRAYSFLRIRSTINGSCPTNKGFAESMFNLVISAPESTIDSPTPVSPESVEISTMTATLGLNPTRSTADMGRASCGVELGRTKQFVKQVERYRGVTFRGLWWHDDLFGASGLVERRRLHFEKLDRIRDLKDEIEDAGIAVEMLSGQLARLA